MKRLLPILFGFLLMACSSDDTANRDFTFYNSTFTISGQDFVFGSAGTILYSETEIEQPGYARRTFFFTNPPPVSGANPMNYAYGLMISVVYPDEGFINGAFAAGSDNLYVRYNLGGDFRLTSGTVHIEQLSGNRFRIAFGDMSMLSFNGVDRPVAGVFDDEMTLIASDTQVPQLP